MFVHCNTSISHLTKTTWIVIDIYVYKKPRPSELDHSDQEKQQTPEQHVDINRESLEKLGCKCWIALCRVCSRSVLVSFVSFVFGCSAGTWLRPCTGPQQRNAPRPFLSPQTGGTLLPHPVGKRGDRKMGGRIVSFFSFRCTVCTPFLYPGFTLDMHNHWCHTHDI